MTYVYHPDSEHLPNLQRVIQQPMIFSKGVGSFGGVFNLSIYSLLDTSRGSPYLLSLFIPEVEASFVILNGFLHRCI